MPHLSLLYSDISDEERSGGAEAPYAAGSLLGIRRRALSGNPSLLLACLTEGPAYICCRMSTAADEQQRLFEGHSPLLGQDLGFDVSSLTGALVGGGACICCISCRIALLGLRLRLSRDARHLLRRSVGN